MKRNSLNYILALSVLTAGLLVNEDVVQYPDDSLFKAADARVGRPLTPVSVAGVARRTTRRTIARTSVYVAALPVGCSTVMINGVSVSQCGGVYYQPYGGRYVVVNVY